MWCSTKTTFDVYVSQRSQIQFEDEDHAVYTSFRLVTTTLSSLRTTACDALIVPSGGCQLLLLFISLHQLTFLEITEAYLLQILCTRYFRVLLINGCMIGLKRIIKLMNHRQVFGRVIRLLITFSVYKQWLKCNYLKGVVFIIVSTTIFVKPLINLTIIDYVSF